MPLTEKLKRTAEDEVKLWAREVGMGLRPTGHMKDQVRVLTAEVLYRRMQEKYPNEMIGFNLSDLKESTFSAGDYFNDNWFVGNAPPGSRTIVDDGRLS